MNKNLDLTEILKDAPKGTKLWSPVCRECTLVEVLNGENLHPIICMTKTEGGDTCRCLGMFLQIKKKMIRIYINTRE